MSDSIIEIQDDGFTIDQNHMMPYKLYLFEYDGTKMGVKKIDDDGTMELFTYEEAEMQ